MATLTEPFTPEDTVQRTTDPVTREILPPRLSTTQEQEEQAVAWALTQMAELRIWTLAVPVQWSRGEPTTITVHGHAEHMGSRIIPVFDRISDEVDVDGRPVDRTPEARFAKLQTELEEAWTVEGL